MCMTECKKYNYIFILNTKTYALSLTEHALLSPLSVLLLGNYAPLLMIRALPWTNHAPLSGEHALFRKLYALSETKHAPSHGKDTLLTLTFALLLMEHALFSFNNAPLETKHALLLPIYALSNLKHAPSTPVQALFC